MQESSTDANHNSTQDMKRCARFRIAIIMTRILGWVTFGNFEFSTTDI